MSDLHNLTSWRIWWSCSFRVWFVYFNFKFKRIITFTKSQTGNTYVDAIIHNDACTYLLMLTPATAKPHSNRCLSLVFARVIHRLRGQALTSQDCNSYRLLGISSLLVAGSLDSSSPLFSSSHPSYSSFSSISIFSCRDFLITAIPHHHSHT